jgi:hypothetical protein
MSSPNNRNQTGILRNNVFRRGRLTRNPFLNYVAEYRGKVANRRMTQPQIVTEAAQQWNALTPAQKKPYLEMAKRIQLMIQQTDSQRSARNNRHNEGRRM